MAQTATEVISEQNRTQKRSPHLFVTTLTLSRYMSQEAYDLSHASMRIGLSPSHGLRRLQFGRPARRKQRGQSDCYPSCRM